MCFESMLGLKINYEKSEAFVTGGDLEEQLCAAQMMNMNRKLGTLLIKYLGMSLTNCHLRIEDFEFIMNRVGKRYKP